MKRLIWFFIFFLVACSGELYVDETPDPQLNKYPLHLSWGDVDTDNDGVRENYITPIRSQPCSDCFIYAAVGLLEVQFQIDHKMQIKLDLSEQNIHNCLKVSCSATGGDRPILNHLRDYGVMPEAYVPSGSWGKCNNCTNYLSDGGTGITTIEQVPFFRLGSWQTVVSSVMNMDRDTIRQRIVEALQSGPVTIYISGWNGLKRDGNMLYCTEWKSGAHHVVVVGYKFHGRVLVAKNSHGENGLINIAFDGAEECGLTDSVNQITPGSTYSTWGSGERFCYSTNDIDGDKIPDVHDNCPWTINVDQTNSDNDMFGDVCDECPNDMNKINGFYCAPKPESKVLKVSPDVFKYDKVTQP